MAKAKKKSKPAAKKQPTSAAKPRARAKKAAPVRLSGADRQAKLKPGDSLNEFLDDIQTAWSLVKNKVRVPGVTLASLARKQRVAAKKTKTESDLIAKQQAKLAPLTDARIIANDDGYRDGLKVKRIADAIAETDPEVAEAFATVNERFRNAPSAASADTTTADPNGPQTR